jgi:hypothetical protein
VTDISEKRLSALGDELMYHPPMQITFQPATILALVGVVQLALRHPGLHGHSRAAAETFIASVREYFADCPLTLGLIHEGDQPQP